MHCWRCTTCNPAFACCCSVLLSACHRAPSCPNSYARNTIFKTAATCRPRQAQVVEAWLKSTCVYGASQLSLWWTHTCMCTEALLPFHTPLRTRACPTPEAHALWLLKTVQCRTIPRCTGTSYISRWHRGINLQATRRYIHRRWAVTHACSIQAVQVVLSRRCLHAAGPLGSSSSISSSGSGRLRRSYCLCLRPCACAWECGGAGCVALLPAHHCLPRRRQRRRVMQLACRPGRKFVHTQMSASGGARQRSL